MLSDIPKNVPFTFVINGQLVKCLLVALADGRELPSKSYLAPADKDAAPREPVSELLQLLLQWQANPEKTTRCVLAPTCHQCLHIHAWHVTTSLHPGNASSFSLSSPLPAPETLLPYVPRAAAR